MGIKSIYDRFRASKLVLGLLRVFQFLSAVISLGLFSSRLYKVYRLTQRIGRASGAVEGILAAAVAYTIVATLLQFLLRSRAARVLRWLMILLDIAFVIAFSVVAGLTRPNGGSAGPCLRRAVENPTSINDGSYAASETCQLPWGTFILAIVSTLLHAATALFHEVRDHHKKTKREREAEKANGLDMGSSDSGANDYAHGNANGYGNGNGNSNGNTNGHGGTNSHGPRGGMLNGDGPADSPYR